MGHNDFMSSFSTNRVYREARETLEHPELSEKEREMISMCHKETMRLLRKKKEMMRCS